MQRKIIIVVILGLIAFGTGLWIGWGLGKPGDDTNFEREYREAQNRIESLERELAKFGSIIGDLRTEISRAEKLMARQREVERVFEDRIREHEAHNVRLRDIVGDLERENQSLRERTREHIDRIDSIEKGLGGIEELLQFIEAGGNPAGN